MHDDTIKIHIWKLPEKNNTVDKSNEYSIIYDEYVKKVKLEKLYEYFNQDYKIDNIVKYFEDIMSSIDKEYSPKYSLLELSLDQYELLVQELQEKFKVNRDNIRELESIFNLLNRDVDDIVLSFEDIDNKCVILMSTLENFIEKVSEISSTSNKNTKNIKELNSDVSKLIENASQLYINSGSMKTQISNIRDSINEDVTNKKDMLIKNINDEYDKILAIIDYYHHIHENKL